MLVGQLKLKVILMVAIKSLETELELFPPTTHTVSMGLVWPENSKRHHFYVIKAYIFKPKVFLQTTKEGK